MLTARLTRVVSFSAAHRYYRSEWTAERNAATFGACASEHSHGHTYECHVTVAGQVAADTHMVMDLAALDRILVEEVTRRFDQRNINLDVPEFGPGGLVPTSEALAVFIWGRVASRLPAGTRLYCVRVQEDPHLYAEYYGDD